MAEIKMKRLDRSIDQLDAIDKKIDKILFQNIEVLDIKEISDIQKYMDIKIGILKSIEFYNRLEIDGNHIGSCDG